ncbi:unnamed protein product [Cuscuta campestris]|uniref:Uncharacterized protein n=1 Tax=Cuscuta campestris TaxID=132261 RepID=A0A484MPX3_9ASTE|nr:unnamed protein product [Cuscuta campestris]
MATYNKVCLFTVVFLVCGIFLMGNNVEQVNAQICTQECNPNAAYMICQPNNKKTKNVCTNCCKIQNTRCHIYTSKGGLIC